MKKDLKSITQVLSVGFSNVLLTFFQAILLTRLLTIEDCGHVQLFIVSTTIFCLFSFQAQETQLRIVSEMGRKRICSHFGYIIIIFINRACP